MPMKHGRSRLLQRLRVSRCEMKHRGLLQGMTLPRGISARFVYIIIIIPGGRRGTNDAHFHFHVVSHCS